MANLEDQEKELQARSRRKLVSSGSELSPLEQLQAKLLERGAKGIKNLSRAFRIMDDDGSKRLNFEEFRYGIQDVGVRMPEESVRELFTTFDVNGDGSVSVDEFLLLLQPKMSANRLELVKAAFKKLDRTGDGVVTVEDLENVYDPRHHPKYQNGEKTARQVLREFLDSFDVANQKDGKVTWEEFCLYYAAISCSIDKDSYFDLMMRRSWGI